MYTPRTSQQDLAVQLQTLLLPSQCRIGQNPKNTAFTTEMARTPRCCVKTSKEDKLKTKLHKDQNFIHFFFNKVYCNNSGWVCVMFPMSAHRKNCDN
ncbi:hypothetical protein FKM82_006703 [Ascaphus truei]